MAAQDIIIRPIITEKSMAGIGAKKYTFEVAKDATKIDIAHAVEALFDVKVQKVNTMHVRGHLRRQGRSQGYTRSWKKAIVTLAESSKAIPFFEGMI
ncbi:50S ribosomal protein L23 [Yeguia hominis]|uniref:Large ribosomal subunit protein uL23 n=1 Tax=Yeguia hominis TaxID=2763662 RepID=A0A926D8S1_9FIRM|nr:50S ribosomal protein L23 [Yeguia hominis]MBC8533321.1 50S ribosomal protein L23 [Yeguia hominis]